MIAGANYRISNCGSGFDTQMTISDLTGTAVADNDDNGPACAGTAASIDFVPPANGTYRIQLNRYNCQAGGNGNMLLNGDIVVTLLSNAPSAPSNDECASATALTVNPTNTCTTSTSGTTVGATDSGVGAINCGGFTGTSNDDVWYSFVATSPNHDITVTPNTLGDFVIDLRSGACNGANIACADDFIAGAEIINATGLTTGVTYYVRVYSYDASGSSGTFDICVTTPSISYCTPTTDTPDEIYITEISFEGTLQDTSNSSTFTGGYEEYTTLTPISRQVEGEGINVSVTSNMSGRIKAWVDWNNDGNFDDNAATELVYDTTNTATSTTTFGFVIPLGTAAGDYRIRIRNFIYFDYIFFGYFWDYNYNACEPFYDGLFIDDYGEAEDYLFTVEPYCDALITSISEGDTCGPGTVTLNATATGSPSVVEYRWYANETGGTALANTPTGSWTTPSISSTTTYWVTAYNGTCESWVRTPITANFNPIPTLSVTPDASSRVICGENDALEISATGDVDDLYLFNEDFETGSLGIFSNVVLIDNGPAVNNLTSWQNRTSTFVPSEEVWFPAISSGFGPNQFVMSNSDVGPYTTENTLTTTTSYNTLDFTSLTLSLKMYYSHYLADNVGGANDYVAIEASTNGTVWTNVTPNIIADVGIGTKFETLSYNLDAYINQPTLSIRIRFYAVWSDGVGVDDIKLFGNKDITAVTWTTTPVGIVDLYEDTGGVNPYTGDVRQTVYAIPNITQLEDAQFDFAINGNFANGCGSNSLNFSVTNNTRIWSGAAISDWDTDSNWKPAQVPTADNCVIIANGAHAFVPHNRGGIPPTLYDAFARNIDIKSGGILEIVSRNNLTVTEGINIDGNLDINDVASLVQIDNFPNTGSGLANVDRLTPNGMDILDYTYWSSAVTLGSSFTLNDLSPNTPNGLYYRWEPTIGGNHGNWISVDPLTTNMEPGQGYIIRAPSDIANTVSYPRNAFNGRFEGIPNNGNIDVPISIGTLPASDDDNWNLIGNPYPSAIDITTFLNYIDLPNGIDNPATIDGTVYLWTRNSAPSAATPDPFYGNFSLNYTENDYASVNFLGSTNTAATGGQTPKQYIASGQAFFVRGLSNGSIRFKNSMRVVNDNDTFFRSTNSSSTSSFEKHRIWLNLSDNAGGYSQLLVGYAEGATFGWDRGLDGLAFAGNAVSFYSLTDDDILTIQGRPLPFQEADIVPLGFNAIDQNNFTIGIDHFDELFINQEIYLEDTYLGIIHDLKLSPYAFTSEEGTFNDRFVLRYTNNALSLDDAEILNGIKVFEEQEKLIVKSQYQSLESIEVYDILGRTLFSDTNINASQLEISTINPGELTLFLKIKLINGQQKIEKIIY